MDISKQNNISANSLLSSYNLLHNTLPSGDLETYSRNILDAGTTADVASQTPDGYGPIDWGRDTYHAVMGDIAGFKRDRSFGNAMFDLDDINTLTKAQLYIQTKKDLLILEDALTTAILNHDPIELLKAKAGIHQLNTKIFSEGLNTAYLKAFVDLNFQTEDTNISFDKNLTPAQLILQAEQAKQVLNNQRMQLIATGNLHLLDVDYHQNLTSDYYLTKANSGEDNSWLNPDTYLYKLPGLLAATVATPLANIATMVGSYMATTGAATVAAATEGGSVVPGIGNAVGAAVGTVAALAGAGLAVGSRLWGQHYMSSALTYEDYKLNVQLKLQQAGVNTNNVLDYARQLYFQQNGQPAANDDELWDGLLQGRLKSGNTVFDRTALNATKGLQYVKDKNNAMSLWGVAQDVLAVAPLGAITKIARATPGVKQVMQGADALNNAAHGLGSKISDQIDNAILFGIAKSPAKLAALTRRKLLVDIAGRLMLSSAMSGSQMATQLMINKLYQAGDTEDNASTLKLFGEDMFDSARSIYAALTPFDPVYSSDQDFVDNYKNGVLMGLVQGAGMGLITNGRNFVNQNKVSKLLGDMYTSLFDAKDFVQRNRTYAKADKYGSQANIADAFDQLSKLKIPDVTPEILKDEQDQAQQTMAFASRKSVKKFAQNDLGIDPKSSDYDTYVALSQYYNHNALEANKDYQSALNKAEQTNESKDILNNFHNELLSQLPSDQPIDTNIHDALLKQYAIKGALEQSLEDLSKLTPTDLTKDGYNKVLSSTKQLLKQIDSNIQLLKDTANKTQPGSITDDTDKTIQKYAQDLSGVYHDNKVDSYLIDSLISNANALSMSPYVKPSDLSGFPKQVRETIANGINKDKKLFITDKISKYNDMVAADNQFELNIHYQDIGAPLAGEEQAKEVELRQEQPTETPKPANEQPITPTNSEPQPTPGPNNPVPESGGTAATKEVSKPVNIELPLEAHTESVTHDNSTAEQLITPAEKVSLNAPESQIEASEKKPVSTLIPEQPNYTKKTPEERSVGESKLFLNDNFGVLNDTAKSTDERKEALENIQTEISANDKKGVKLNIPQSSLDLLDKYKNELYPEEGLKVDEALEKPTITEAIDLTKLEVTPTKEEQYKQEQELLPPTTEELPTQEQTTTQPVLEVEPEKTIPEQVPEQKPVKQELVSSKVPVEEINKLAEEEYPNIANLNVDGISHKLKFINYGNEDTYTGFEKGKVDPVFGHEYADKWEAAKSVSKQDFLSKSKVRFEIRDFTYSDGKKAPAIFALFDYKGKTYVSAVNADVEHNNGLRQLALKRGLQRANVVGSHITALRNKILYLFNGISKSDDKNAHIVPISIKRTNGELFTSGGDIRNTKAPVDQTKTVNQSIHKNPIFGIKKNLMDVDADNTPIAISRLNGLMYKGVAYPVKNTNIGSIYAIIPAERTPGGIDTIVRLFSKRITDEPKNKLLMVGEHLLNLLLADRTAKYGNSSVPNGTILDFLVNNGLKTLASANVDQSDPRYNDLQSKIFTLILNDKGIFDKANICGTTYNVSDLIGDKLIRKQAINDIINNLSYNMDKQSLWENHFGDTESETNPFRSVYYDMKVNGDKNSKFDLIPGVLSISPKEFGLKWNDDSNRFEEDSNHLRGMSTLGYMIKNGWLKSDLDVENPFVKSDVYIDDVKLESTQDLDLAKVTETLAKQESPLSTEKSDLSNMTITEALTKMFGGDFKGTQDNSLDGAPKVEVNPTYTDTLDTNSATEWLGRTLGLTEENGGLDLTDVALHVTKSGALIMGLTREDCIQLSTTARRGTEYHEAWHRVSNLLLNDKQRNALFLLYRKSVGNNKLTDAQVDEGLADKFMDYLLTKLSSINYLTTNVFKKVYNFIKTWSSVGNYKLARIYNNINTGKYKDAITRPEEIARFREIYKDGGAPFTVQGVKFEHIMNSAQVKSITQSLLSTLLFSNNKYTDVEHTDFSFTKAMLDNQVEKAKDDAENNPELQERYDAIKEVLDHFTDVFVPKVKQLLRQLKINVKEDENAVNEHIKASYEYSRTKNATTAIKYLFLTIPAYRENTDDTLSLDTEPVTGLPRFHDPIKSVNTILNDLHQFTNLKDMTDTISKLGLVSPFYRDFAKRLITIHDELTWTLFETMLHSAKHEFITCKISKDPEDGSISISLVNNSVDYKAMQYPRVWSLMMFNGTKIFNQVKDENNNYSTHLTPIGNSIINRATSLYKSIDQGFKSKDKTYTIALKGGSHMTVDLNTHEGIEYTKDLLVKILNNVGIMVDKSTINNALLSKNFYNASSLSEHLLLNNFVTGSAGKNIGSLRNVFNLLEDVQRQGKGDRPIDNVNTRSNNNALTRVQELYNGNGFVKFLAQQYSKTIADTEETMSLGANNNKLYAIASNDFVFDRVNELNSNDNIVQRLANNVYSKGSLILNKLQRGKGLGVETFVNFKEDVPNDAGSDYFDITDKEDYIAKMAATSLNRIVLPTIADKKTYHFIKGVELPHDTTKWTVGKSGKPIALYGNDFLDLFNKYIDDDYNAVSLGIKQVDDSKEGKQDPEWIDPSLRIANYLTPSKMKMLDGTTKLLPPNCTRFRFINGVYYFEDGKEKFVDFNDPNHTAKYNLLNFHDFFYTSKYRNDMISALLDKSTQHELKYAKSIGIIDFETDDKGNIQLNTLKNVLLDLKLLNDRIKEYSNDENPDVSKHPEGYAVYDMIARHAMNTIISVNEFEKLFSGDPAFYKLVYKEGQLPDTSIDKIKRLGAMTSTGLNNRLDFDVDPIDKDYSCAELKDIEVKSAMYNQLRHLFVKGSILDLVRSVSGENLTGELQTEIDNYLSKLNELNPDTTKQVVTPDELPSTIDRNLLNQAILQGEARADSYKKGINVADAAVYVSPTMYAKLMRMNGLFNDKIKLGYNLMTDEGRLYLNSKEAQYMLKYAKDSIQKDGDKYYINAPADKVLSDPALYKIATGSSMQVLKYMSFGNRDLNNGKSGTNTVVPYFNKMALFPLFKSMATGSIKPLYDRMMDKENPLDMALFESAVKVGSCNPTDYYDDVNNGTVTDLNKLNVYRLEFKYLRQLLNTDPHEEDKAGFGTQALKISMSNIVDTDKYGRGEDTLTGQLIKENVFNSIKALSDIGRQQIEKQLFDEEGNINDKNFIDMIRNDAEQTGADDNILDALQVGADGKSKIPLAALSDNAWLESRLISYINKNVINIDMPGMPMVQRSDFGIRDGDGLKTLSEKELNLGRKLNLLNEDGSMDSIASIGLFRDIIPNYNKLSYEQARQWLKDEGIIGDNGKIEAMGYRIPTQAAASISPLRFVDVLPEMMNDTVILPDEFTKLTGSDFDIDKLFVSRYEYDDSYDGSKNGQPFGIHRSKMDETKELGEQDAKALKNNLLDNYMRILTTPDMLYQMKQSIDNPTDRVKSVLADIESNNTPDDRVPFKEYGPAYQEERKFEYTSGKKGMGPTALSNAHLVLTQLSHLRFSDLSKDYNLLERLGITRLDRIYDIHDGHTVPTRVLDWSSALLNAFADVAKDPYIVRLNIADATYNMANLLTRSGMGKRSFYFLAQPILKEMSQAIERTKGSYGVSKYKSLSQLKKEAVDSILLKYDPDSRIRNRFIAELKHNPDFLNEKIQLLFKVTKSVKDANGVIQPDTELRHLLVDRNKYEDDEYNTKLILTYLAYQKLEPYADALQALVMATRVDTKKTGKSEAQQTLYTNRLNEAKLDRNHIFDRDSLNNLFSTTFLDKEFDNSVGLTSRILNSLMLRTHPVVKLFVNNILYSLGKITYCSDKTITRLNHSTEASIKSEFFNKYMLDNDINMKDMMYGDNTIAKRVLKLKNDIYNGKIDGMLNLDGSIANDFLNYLIPNINLNPAIDKSPDTINTSSILSNDATENNNLINHWADLLEHDNPEVRALARDLAVYAFNTSGDYNASNTFFKYLPNSFRESMGYNDFIRNKMESLDAGPTFNGTEARDIYLNNWYNDDVVKPIKLVEYGRMVDYENNMVYDHSPSFYTTFNVGDDNEKPILIYGKRTNRNIGSDIKPSAWLKTDDGQLPIYAPYIKVQLSRNNDPSNTLLYRLLGYNIENDPHNPAIHNYYPLYALVEKKGMKYQGHTVVEYDKETSDLKANHIDPKHLAGYALNNMSSMSDIESWLDGLNGESNYSDKQALKRLKDNILEVLRNSNPISDLIDDINKEELSDNRYMELSVFDSDIDLSDDVDTDTNEEHIDDPLNDVNSFTPTSDLLMLETREQTNAEDYLNNLTEFGATENEEATKEVIDKQKDYSVLSDDELYNKEAFDGCK